MGSSNGPLRVGIGGPVGSGKTTLTEKLCKAMREDFSIAVVTNDIYTKEDAMILARRQALSEDRIVGVETGDVRIRRYAKTPRSTFRRSPSSPARSPTSISSSSDPVATTLRPPSRPIWPT